MFSQVCQEFCPWGVYTPLGRYNPQADTPHRHPPGQTLLLGRPPQPEMAWADTLPPTPETATAADGINLTGMHSCLHVPSKDIYEIHMQRFIRGSTQFNVLPYL